MISVKDAITGRQSIRAFLKDKPVPRALIGDVLRRASRAPSGSNIQPWNVWVVDGAAQAQLSTELFNRHMAGDLGDHGGEREYNYYPVDWRDPSISQRRACGWGLYGTLGIKKGETERTLRQHGCNYEFFDAPAGLFFTIDRDLELGSWLDMGMFIYAVMMSARGFGLETCAQAAFLNYFETVTSRIGVPASQQLVCGMPIGYPDPGAPVNTFRTERDDGFVRFVDELAQSDG